MQNMKMYDEDMKQKDKFSKSRGVLQRKRRREKKLFYGILPKKRGRPPKEQAAQRNTKAELQYQFARKEARIKQLEMENELMRDFLSLAERK